MKSAHHVGMLERQVLGPHPRPTESETLVVVPSP